MSLGDEARIIYLDYAATTPVDDRVLEAMHPFLTRHFANAASQHAMGRAAAKAVDQARAQLADLAGCLPDDVIWTSGATEANNLALKGAVRASKIPKPHVISQATEHRAVLDPIASLREAGADVTLLDVDADGTIDSEAVRQAIRPETVLVSIMAANNEIGVQFPVGEIAAFCDEVGVPFHTDASQAAGKVPLDMTDSRIDLLSVSGHKIYGPKGVGALLYRRSPKLKKLVPLIDGGGHERGMRSGTLNVPAIVGLGAAASIAKAEMRSDAERLGALRDSLENDLLDRLAEVAVNGSGSCRLPHISNLAFAGVDAESLLLALERIAASTGSACTAHSLQPSHVLRAMKLTPERQRSSIRISLGRQTTALEIDEATEEIVKKVGVLRQLSVVDDLV